MQDACREIAWWWADGFFEVSLATTTETGAATGTVADEAGSVNLPVYWVFHTIHGDPAPAAFLKIDEVERVFLAVVGSGSEVRHGETVGSATFVAGDALSLTVRIRAELVGRISGALWPKV